MIFWFFKGFFLIFWMFFVVDIFEMIIAVWWIHLWTIENKKLSKFLNQFFSYFSKLRILKSIFPSFDRTCTDPLNSSKNTSKWFFQKDHSKTHSKTHLKTQQISSYVKIHSLWFSGFFIFDRFVPPRESTISGKLLRDSRGWLSHMEVLMLMIRYQFAKGRFEIWYDVRVWKLSIITLLGLGQPRFCTVLLSWKKYFVTYFSNLNSFPFTSINFHFIRFHSFSIHFSFHFPFIFAFSFHSFPIIFYCFYSFPFICIHFRSFLFIFNHFYSFLFQSLTLMDKRVAPLLTRWLLTGRLSSYPLCLVVCSAKYGCLVLSPKQTNKQTNIYFHSFRFMNIH